MFGPDTELLSGRHVIFIDVGCTQAVEQAQELFGFDDGRASRHDARRARSADRLRAGPVARAEHRLLHCAGRKRRSGAAPGAAVQHDVRRAGRRRDQGGRRKPGSLFRDPASQRLWTRIAAGVARSRRAAYGSRSRRATPAVHGDDAAGSRVSRRPRAPRRAPDVGARSRKRESASCARASPTLMDEAANNERLLKRSQERELELLKAENLAQLFDAICSGPQNIVRARIGDAAAARSAARDPPSADRRPSAASRISRKCCSPTASSGMAPQFNSFHRPWLGPYMGCDHQLLFPGQCRHPQRRR